MEEKINKILLAIMLTTLLVVNFYGNIFAGKDEVIVKKEDSYREFTFETFQDDSEYLVHSKIFADKYLEEKSNYGLFFIYHKSDETRIGHIENEIKYFGNNSNYKDFKFIREDYKPQFGLQGHIFSYLHNKIHMPIWSLKLICCILMAVVIIGICYGINKKYNKLMALIFYITFLLSPWVVSFAKNLYWVEFTWFLPPLFGLLLSLDYSKWKIYVPCIFTAIFIKCLCGYEYISSIMLMTIAFFIIDLFIAKDKEKRIEILKTILIVGITCVLAFVAALCLHAPIRGNGNIIEGLKQIYNEDVVRRTIIAIGDVQNTEGIKRAADATILETVGLYFDWKTNIILGINGQCFVLMFIATLLIIFYNIIKRKDEWRKEVTMYMIFLITTLSWLILGKSHSYYHTHMNYVLWYFGFIQICLYLISKFICEELVKEKKE